MKIELRSRKHKSGNTTLYLEIYEKGGKRQYESLNLYDEKGIQDKVRENTGYLQQTRGKGCIYTCY